MTSEKASIPHIAVWTTDLSVVTGQNIVTRRVVGNSSTATFTIFDYPPGRGAAIPAAILCAFKLGIAVLTKRFSTIYVVCSRSTSGFLRDVPVLILSRLGKRVVVHVHGSDFPLLLEHRVIGWFSQWLYRRCEVVVPSTHLLPRLAGHQFGRLSVCENFAAPLNIQLARKNESAEVLSELVVLWNSNVMATKGIAELVDGVRAVRMKGGRLKLVVLGRPIGDVERTQGQMQTFLDLLANEEWVEVVGSVAPEDVQAFVAACDVVALPSTYDSECQPLAVIQAMLAGRELIVADTPALRATVGNYPARFVERTPTSIASALTLSLQNRDHSATKPTTDLTKVSARFAPNAFDQRMAAILSDLHRQNVD